MERLTRKRDGSIVPYQREKIELALQKAAKAVNLVPFKESFDLSKNVEFILEKEFFRRGSIPSVEEIQDLVEIELMKNSPSTAKAYVLYRAEKTKQRFQKWEMTELQSNIFHQKYEYDNEGFEGFLDRISNGNEDIKKLIRQKKFIFAGRILANRGLNKFGRKVTYSNCYVLPSPEDNLESIFNTASQLARTYSYGGGVGFDIGKLRPNGSHVNNAAKTTTGAVSFMDLYSLVTGLIGQNNRRGALMLSMPCDHPDLEEFIDIKTDLEKVTKANISIRNYDDFMLAVKNKDKYTLRFVVKDTGEIIEKEIDADRIFTKLAHNNWRTAEPGMIYWDNINKWHIMSEDKDFEYVSLNPCANEYLWLK